MLLRKSSFICVYLRLCLWHLAFDMRVVQHIRDTWLFFAFTKNCLSVVIISHVWDAVIILCFHRASDCPALLTLAFPCINWGDSASSAWIWSSHFLVAMCASTLGMQTLSQAQVPVRISFHLMGWLSSPFHSFQWRLVSLEMYCLWPTVFCWAVVFYGQAFSFSNTVWAMFLEEYP